MHTEPELRGDPLASGSRPPVVADSFRFLLGSHGA